MANRLQHETSPYLRQHQHNPVDWHPWDEEALARARAENRPILLSVGYSSCHWCHVMERESFENPETARLMNEHYVSIKVDREERPDLDQVYQNVAQAMTGGGGWPLTVFLTPDLKPFYGGTYFPPEDRWGRPGFPRVLQALADAFRDKPEMVRENAEKLVAMIRSLEVPGDSLGHSPAEAHGERAGTITLESLEDAGRRLLDSVDWSHGGFAGAPKFPNTSAFSFLWRAGLAAGLESAREATALTLLRMAEGGIHDHLGGGFSRYSVDERWAVPHFEKMLYDNALLLRLYSEVVLTDGRPEALFPEPLLEEAQRALFVGVIEDTATYVLREMTSPEGGFYSAQDADSEGVEGKFFVWTPAQLRGALSEEEARVFALRYGVTEQGNFEDHSTASAGAAANAGGSLSATVLSLAMPVGETAARAGITEERAEALLRSAREKLFEVRSMRVAPGLDDKVLASWNGMMISGLAWAAAALDASGRTESALRARAAANRAFDFVRERMSRPGGRLWSVYKGEARFNAYLDDYAFLAQGAIDLARFEEDADRVQACLGAAREWLSTVVRHFKDDASPGYFFTSDDHERLIQRPKAIFDQSVPSGTAVALEAMAALTELGHGDFRAELDRQLPGLLPPAMRAPYGSAQLLCLALLHLQGPVTVAGPGASRACFHPHVFQKEAPQPAVGLLVCHRQTCGRPLASPEEAAAEAVRKVMTR